MAAHPDTIVDRETPSLGQDLEAFVASYRPLPGVFDEMMDGDGRVRAHWQPFLGRLAALGADEINRRFAAADLCTVWRSCFLAAYGYQCIHCVSAGPQMRADAGALN